MTANARPRDERRSVFRLSLLLGTWLPVVMLVAAGGSTTGPTGRLTLSAGHPYCFRDGDRQVFLVGVSDRALFFLWENDKGFSWRNYLVDLASHRLNYVRQDFCNWGGLLTDTEYPGQFSQPAWPFARSGPEQAIDGKPKFNLNRFDQTYFDERIKLFLREAAQRGIYVELTLFEEQRRRDFSASLYADDNNVNQLHAQPGMITSDQALGNARLLAVQHAFLDRVLRETSAFGNVVYEIANESGGQAWVAHMIDYITEHPDYGGQLISAGEQTSPFNPKTGRNHIIAKHRGGGGLYATDADVRSHHLALRRFRVGKPVMHNEYFLFANRSTDDVNFPRKMMWADFTAGGHSNFFDFHYWRGTGRTVHDGDPSRSPPAEILKGGEFLVRFITEQEVPFWAMAPNDGSVEVVPADGSSVFTLAQPGAAYLSYVLGHGPLKIRTDLKPGTYAGTWYDPKSGRVLRSSEIQSAAAPSELDSPPFDQDIVLYLRRTPGQGSSAPR